MAALTQPPDRANALMLSLGFVKPINSSFSESSTAILGGGAAAPGADKANSPTYTPPCLSCRQLERLYNKLTHGNVKFSNRERRGIHSLQSSHYVYT